MSLPSPVPGAPPEDVFAAMLRAARPLLAMRHPLDVEVVVSELLGAWWGKRPRGADAERVLGEGLVDHAATEGTPAAAALLSAMAVLGRTRRQRVRAKQALGELLRSEVRLPRWARTLGKVIPGPCYLSGTRYGDVDDVICTFTYGQPSKAAGADSHAIIAVIDYNAGGILRDGWVTTKVDLLLERCRTGSQNDAMSTFTELDPRRARTLLRAAAARTEAALPVGSGGNTSLLPPPTHAPVPDPGAGSLAASHALLRARIRALPGRGVPPRRPQWPREHRATLAARFLASPEAEELSDSYAASRCADHIIDHGCDVDLGRPLRVSPHKVEAFLMSWLPRRVALSPAEAEAMPHILAAWVRWAGARSGLPEPALRATLDTVWNTMPEFGSTYAGHPGGYFGLRREVVNRLLPDGDLSALPRRMFTFPLLASEVIPPGERYDPSTREGRRALLRLDHFNGQQPSHGKHATDTFGGSPEVEEALDQHEVLAKRLWDGDPPNLWEAAQRLMDRGMTRVSVIEALLETVQSSVATGSPITGLVKRLDDL